jgi:hypothetical protein
MSNKIFNWFKQELLAYLAHIIYCTINDLVFISVNVKVIDQFSFI